MQVDGGAAQQPHGGAHHDHQGTSAALRDAILSNLDELAKLNTQQLLDARYAKFRSFGEWEGK